MLISLIAEEGPGDWGGYGQAGWYVMETYAATQASLPIWCESITPSDDGNQIWGGDTSDTQYLALPGGVGRGLGLRNGEVSTSVDLIVDDPDREYTASVRVWSGSRLSTVRVYTLVGDLLGELATPLLVGVYWARVTVKGSARIVIAQANEFHNNVGWQGLLLDEPGDGPSVRGRLCAFGSRRSGLVS